MPGIRGLSRPLLPSHELGGRTRRESRAHQERVGAVLPSAPARSLSSRSHVRVGIACAGIGMIGGAGAMVIGPAWVLVALAAAMVACVLALALIEERRRPSAATVAAMREMVQAAGGELVSILWSDGERRCRVCGCTDDEPCVTPDRTTGLLMPCAWREPDLCSACADGADS